MVDISECDVPIPTFVISKTLGLTFNESVLLADSLILLSFTLTTYRSCGNLVVRPMPGTVVCAIPIACVVPAPAVEYLTFSPVTK